MSIRFPIICKACKLRRACLSSAESALELHLAGISVLAHESGSYSSIKRLNSILIQYVDPEGVSERFLVAMLPYANICGTQYM